MKLYSYKADVDLPADINKYARSSYGLSDIDLNRIASYIQECTDNIASIERQLSMEPEIEQPWPNPIRADLRLRKMTDNWRIRICRQIGAPIRQLPLEILGEIFLLCLPPMNHRVRSLRCHEAPLLLCQVCSSWRTAAIGTPHLWNQLEFQIRYEVGMSIPVDSVEKMKVWLGRGRDLPLSLRLAVFASSYASAGPMSLLAGDSVSLEEVLSQEPFSSVCKLYMSIPPRTSSDLCPSFKRADGFGKRLESLTVGTLNDIKFDQNHVTLLPGSFMLHRAVLVNFLSERPSATLLPWGQLTHLHAGNFLSIETWYRLMSYCINLRIASFGICMVTVDGSVPSSGEVIVLPHLSIFTIMMVSKPNAGDKIPFGGLVLPAMRTLRILFHDTLWLRLSDYSQLHLLRELALIGSSLFVSPFLEDLHDLFQATPLLSSLQLSIYSSYNMLFANLLPTANPPLLPNLENFEIRCMCWRHIRPEDFCPAFVDLVKARWWIPLHSQATHIFRNKYRLRRAVLWLDEEPGEAELYLYIIRKSLQQCVDEGLVLVLRDELGGKDLTHLMPFSSEFRHEDLIDRDPFRFDAQP